MQGKGNICKEVGGHSQCSPDGLVKDLEQVLFKC